MADFKTLLAELLRERVQFVLIGGVAATLRGAPVTTFDLDIVPARDPDNATRLERALRSLGSHYRGHPTVQPTATDLQRPGHHLLLTRAGPLDILGVAIGGRDFDALVERSDALPLGGGLTARVLRLEEIIAMKEELGREKDLAALPMLRTALRLAREAERPPPQP